MAAAPGAECVRCGVHSRHQEQPSSTSIAWLGTDSVPNCPVTPVRTEVGPGFEAKGQLVTHPSDACRSNAPAKQGARPSRICRCVAAAPRTCQSHRADGLRRTNSAQSNSRRRPGQADGRGTPRQTRAWTPTKTMAEGFFPWAWFTSAACFAPDQDDGWCVQGGRNANASVGRVGDRSKRNRSNESKRLSAPQADRGAWPLTRASLHP